MNGNRKQSFKRVAICLLTIVVLFPFGWLAPMKVVFAETDGNYVYSDNGGGTATLWSYGGTDTNLVIPEKVGPDDGLTVTALASGIFVNRGLISVALPSGLTSIGTNAFYGNDLTSVELPDGLVSIGDSAFDGNDLTSVVIPDSVTSMGTRAFAVNQLTSVTLSSGLTALANQAFTGNKITSVTIPEGVVSIGNNVFATNNLTSVMLPDSLQTIGSSAFSYNQISSLVVPEQVTSIGRYAFYSNSLTSLQLPDGLTLLDDNSFGLNKLTSVTIPKQLQTIGVDAFKNNEIASLTFPEDAELLEIYSYAFSGNKLTSLTLPGKLVRLHPYAFAYNDLTSVELPDGLDSINMAVFLGNELMEVTIPRSVTSLGGDVFLNNKLTRVTVLSSETAISGYTFRFNQTATPANLTIVGFPGSTAELNATDNSYTFERYGQALLDALDAANERLTDHGEGGSAGEASQTARYELQTAVDAAQTVADDLANVDPDPLEDATIALEDAIDDFDAAVVQISIALPADRTYGKDDVLAFTVSYADPVTVVGAPVIKLSIGNSGMEQEADTEYTGDVGVPVNDLMFEYKVPLGWMDADGIGVADAIQLPAGADITVSGGGTAELTYGNPGDTSGIRIDSMPTDAEAVALDKELLAIAYASGDSASSVTQDVGLPTSGGSGTTVTWSSDAPGVVGEDGAVVRPSYTTGDASVTLTATIAKGSESVTKTFVLTVVKLAQSDAEAVAADKLALEIAYESGDSASSVTQDVGLPTSGGSGTTVTWSSDAP
ncbi:leucine-rich repeat domain-containing protein, partial [Paenibacillus sp. HB172176]|uniref:leucine-rich repeat domain-containing protein n=1 Tax=Paenibacillus sp. HB172176 TaxID=2493690 RepID=UPI0014397E3B